MCLGVSDELWCEASRSSVCASKVRRSLVKRCWREAVWSSVLVKRLGQAFWLRDLVKRSGYAIWSCALAKRLGQAFWSSVLVKRCPRMCPHRDQESWCPCPKQTEYFAVDTPRSTLSSYYADKLFSLSLSLFRSVRLVVVTFVTSLGGAHCCCQGRGHTRPDSARPRTFSPSLGRLGRARRHGSDRSHRG